jgi:hypothetical protein
MPARPQDPVADLDDQFVLLGQGDELGGPHRAELGRLPAQQRLHAVHRAIAKIDLGLVVQAQLAAACGTGQGVHHRLPAIAPAGMALGGLANDVMGLL